MLQDAGLEPHRNAAAIRLDLAGDGIQVELHVQKVSRRRLGILFSLDCCHYVEDGWKVGNTNQPRSASYHIVILMAMLPQQKTMTAPTSITGSLS